MERDAKYVIVGLFVTAVTIGSVAFLVWLLGTDTAAEGNRYVIHFSNVAGLSEGGAVRYRGVDVGRVLDITIDEQESGRVNVLVGLREGLRLNANTTATLGYQGITGIAYVDLRGDSGEGPPIRVAEGQRYPTIAGEMSGLDKFLDALPDWSDKIIALIDNSNRLLSEENTRLVRESLRSIAELTETLAANRDEIEALIADTGAVLDSASRSAGEIERLVGELGPKAEQTLASIRSTAASLEEVAARVDELIARNDRELDALLDEGSEQLVALAREARHAAAEVADLARRLREDPSSLLYETPDNGVEIAR